MTNINDAGEPVWHRAELRPSSWCVHCPCCGQQVDVEKVEEDDAGAFYGAEECCVAVCEACGAFIEVTGVYLISHGEPPYRVGRGR